MQELQTKPSGAKKQDLQLDKYILIFNCQLELHNFPFTRVLITEDKIMKCYCSMNKKGTFGFWQPEHTNGHIKQVWKCNENKNKFWQKLLLIGQ